MRMTDEEIVRDYRASKAPFKQIGILADLNACTRQAIADVLIRAGCEVPERYTRKAFKLDEPAPHSRRRRKRRRRSR